jgi:hypothetical protein
VIRVRAGRLEGPESYANESTSWAGLRPAISGAAGIALALAAWVGAVAQYVGTLDQHPAIQYASRPATDPASQLARRAAGGPATLAFHPRFGFLPAILAALDVPTDSQILTFSKTGIQGALTSPRTPRALYFNETVVVGYVAGAPFLEIAAHDPEQGVVFHSIDQDPRAPADIRRRDGCITCHLSANSLDVPGLLVRSLFVAPDGSALPQLGSFLIDHRSPFEQRWGGWYVSGTHGSIRHMGNSMVADPARPGSAISRDTLNVTSIAGRFDAAAYLTPHSDLIALMVFEHQSRVVNLLTRIGWEARIAAAESRLDPGHGPLAALVRDLVDYLVFADEAPLPAPIAGTSGFAARFSARGPRDGQGRSLRDLDLGARLMRYPCSYMIYTPAFDALPGVVRDAVLQRLWQVLSGEDRSARYQRLPAADRRAAIEILRATKSGLPAYWGK